MAFGFKSKVAVSGRGRGRGMDSRYQPKKSELSVNNEQQQNKQSTILSTASMHNLRSWSSAGGGIRSAEVKLAHQSTIFFTNLRAKHQRQLSITAGSIGFIDFSDLITKKPLVAARILSEEHGFTTSVQMIQSESDDKEREI